MSMYILNVTLYIYTKRLVLMERLAVFLKYRVCVCVGVCEVKQTHEPTRSTITLTTYYYFEL